MDGDGAGTSQSLSSMHSMAEREAAAASSIAGSEDAPMEKKTPEKEIQQHPSERYTRVWQPALARSFFFFLFLSSLSFFLLPLIDLHPVS
jgi:hypothetical protein